MTMNSNNSSARQPDVITMSLFAATALHAFIILGVSFDPILDKLSTPRSLEVILVQEKTDSERPDEAEYLAQSSQDGGGESDENSRPTSPFNSPSELESDGVAPIPIEASAPEVSTQSDATVITSILGSEKVNSDEQNQENVTEETKVDEVVVEEDLDMAELAAEIDRQQNEFAKRPKLTFVNARTQEAASAEYMFRWVEQVERIGNLNYPEDVKERNLSGAIVLTVGIFKSGEIESIAIDRSSGHSILDASAKQLVSVAGPFDPFTGRLAEETDILYITRTWEFQTGNSVTSYFEKTE